MFTHFSNSFSHSGWFAPPDSGGRPIQLRPSEAGRFHNALTSGQPF
jgi:hypothetical protein